MPTPDPRQPRSIREAQAAERRRKAAIRADQARLAAALNPTPAARPPDGNIRVDPAEFGGALYEALIRGGATPAEAAREAGHAGHALDGADTHGITPQWVLHPLDAIDRAWALFQGRHRRD